MIAILALMEEKMEKWKRAFLLLLGASLLIAACGAAAEQDFAMEAPAEVEVVRAVAEEAAYDTASGSTIATTLADVELPGQPLIIRTGSLSLVVPDTETAIADITGLVEGMGGWVVDSNVYTTGQAKRGNMTVRVPVERFAQAMEQIKDLALEVEGESTSGQDVTEEYVDLTARLNNLEATRDRVRAFLDEARNVEDALAVNQELSRLESEIEQIKGRMKYLSQSASFSTISVGLTPDILSQPIEIAGWRPEGIAKEALEDLVNALQDLGTFLIRFFIHILPILLIIAIPVYLVFRLIRGGIRRLRRGREETPAPPAES